jgi:hypothetical protein
MDVLTHLAVNRLRHLITLVPKFPINNTARPIRVIPEMDPEVVLAPLGINVAGLRQLQLQQLHQPILAKIHPVNIVTIRVLQEMGQAQVLVTRDSDAVKPPLPVQY